MRRKAEVHQPPWMAAHDLNNKLSVIVGNCDLLIEKTEPGTDQARRLAIIREAADAAVKELAEYQQSVETQTRTTHRRKAG